MPPFDPMQRAYNPIIKQVFDLPSRSLVNGAYQKNPLISQPKHMLWVLKRTIYMRGFFWAPKTHVKTNGYENISIFPSKIVFKKPVAKYIDKSKVIKYSESGTTLRLK